MIRGRTLLACVQVSVERSSDTATTVMAACIVRLHLMISLVLIQNQLPAFLLRRCPSGHVHENTSRSDIFGTELQVMILSSNSPSPNP